MTSSRLVPLNVLPLGGFGALAMQSPYCDVTRAPARVAVPQIVSRLWVSHKLLINAGNVLL